MFKMESMAQRLLQARKGANFGSATKAAESLGVPGSTYRAHENGQNDFSADEARQYAKKFGVEPGWLYFGGGTLQPVEPDEPYSEPAGGNVPEYDVRAQGGAGGYTGEIYAQDEFGNKITREGVIKSWLIPDEVLTGQLGATIGKTSIVEVDGDSNYPVINSGDRLIIDHSFESVIPDTLYLIDYGYGPAIKRVSPVAESDPPQCDIVSFNDQVPTQRVHLETVIFRGRVIGRIHRM